MDTRTVWILICDSDDEERLVNTDYVKRVELKSGKLEIHLDNEIIQADLPDKKAWDRLKRGLNLLP